LSLIGDHFATCDRCWRYKVVGTYRAMLKDSKHVCRCDEEERADLEPKELPNGRFQVAA